MLSCHRFTLGDERWRSNTCLMCAGTVHSQGATLDVLLKFFANDCDFDREVEVNGCFQSLCPGLHYPPLLDLPPILGWLLKF